MDAKELECSKGARIGILLATEYPGDLLTDNDVLAALEIKGFAGLLDLLALMEVLDRLLDADGDEQAYDDGCDVNEEVAPGVGGMVRGVDVEHPSSSYRRGSLIVRQLR